uniref:DNA-directed RNA polymerase n=1 Tax=Loa loa TaxID=7209 RepID=A0A1I7W0C5_LOALO
MYFISDDNDELNACCGISTGIKRSIAFQLQELLYEKNFVRLFKTAVDMMPSVIHADKKLVGEHVQRLNASTVEEVAIRTDSSMTQYPIIFRDGIDGYYFNVKMINPVSGVETNMKCVANEHPLMIRENENNQ